MKIRYSLTWKEYWHVSIWRMRQASQRDRLICFGTILVLLLLNGVGFVIIAIRDPIIFPVEARWPLVWLVMFPLSFLLWWLLEGFGCSVEIREDGIVLNRWLEHLRFPWQSIAVLDEDTDSIYLIFNYRPFRFSRVGPIPILIPRRAFPSADEAETFYEQAQKLCREAGGQPSRSVYAGKSLPAH